MNEQRFVTREDIKSALYGTFKDPRLGTQHQRIKEQRFKRSLSKFLKSKGKEINIGIEIKSEPTNKPKFGPANSKPGDYESYGLINVSSGEIKLDSRAILSNGYDNPVNYMGQGSIEFFTGKIKLEYEPINFYEESNSGKYTGQGLINFFTGEIKLSSKPTFEYEASNLEKYISNGKILDPEVTILIKEFIKNYKF